MIEDVDETLEKVKQGEKQYFSYLYTEYKPLILSVLKRIGHIPYCEIDDHLNEIFYLIYKGVYKFRGKSKFSTYIYSIARYYCYHLYKKRKNYRMHVDIEECDQKNVSTSFQEKIEDKLLLEQFLDTLSKKLKTVAIYYYFDRMSLKEIAKTTSISENAVKNRLFQIRAQLKVFLKK